MHDIDVSEGPFSGLYGMHAKIAVDAVRTGGVNPFVTLGFMVILAGLDLTGTFLAKEWTIHRQPWQLVAGATAFLGLFAALALGLRYAEMSVITIGWVVVLQTGVILLDRSRYGTTITTGGWIAIAAIIVLQGYLVLGASTAADVAVAQPSAARAES